MEPVTSVMVTACEELSAYIRPQSSWGVEQLKGWCFLEVGEIGGTVCTTSTTPRMPASSMSFWVPGCAAQGRTKQEVAAIKNGGECDQSWKAFAR